jgi:ComF family protein
MLCRDCQSELGPEDRVSCNGCGAAAPTGQPPPDSCACCQSAGLKFDGVISLGSYQDGLRNAVLRMKRVSERPLSVAMGRWFCLRHGDRVNQLRPEAILPIPMFWGRKVFRGINNPSVLARTISQQLRLPLADRLVERWRNTLPQADLRPRQRFRNVRGAFRLQAGYDLVGGRLLLVDDILTTGATCSEVASLLKRAGAMVVTAAVMARAEGNKR